MINIAYAWSNPYPTAEITADQAVEGMQFPCYLIIRESLDRRAVPMITAGSNKELVLVVNPADFGYLCNGGSIRGAVQKTNWATFINPGSSS